MTYEYVITGISFDGNVIENDDNTITQNMQINVGIKDEAHGFSKSEIFRATFQKGTFDEMKAECIRQAQIYIAQKYI